MKTEATFGLTGLALALPFTAFAAVGVGDVLGTNDGDIRASLEAQGYSVEEIEREDGGFEVEATINGEELEIELSDAGEILAIEFDEPDDDDD